MPRPRRADPQGNSLIASAAILTRDTMVRPKENGVADWQRDAWHFYDTVGEFRFGCDWRASACSRATLTIEEQNGEESITLTEGPEVEALNALFGGESGQGQMLGTVALHYDVPGETYIVGEVVPSDYGPDGSEVDRWSIYSNEELTRNKQGVWKVDRGDGQKRTLADDALVIRLWRSHPRKWVEANSPARAVLPVLRELEGLTKHVGASIDSRLAGAGLLLLPSEMTFTPPPGVQLTPEQAASATTASVLLEMLTEAMVTAIRDRGSAAAVAPIVAQAPGAVLEHVKHITFNTPFDDKAQGLREECLRRLALGLDMPPEVLLGMGDVNHWCVDDQTEVFTRRGWVAVTEFRVGDEVLALDPGTGLAEWAVTDDVYRAHVTDHPMRALESRTHSSVTTLNHRWPTVTPWGTRRWRTSAELSATDRITTGAPVMSLPTVPKYDDALVELAAWFWTEGSIGSCVSIAQSHTVNPERVDRIRAALTVAFGPDSFVEAIQNNESSYGGPVTVFRLRSWAGYALQAIAPGKRVAPDFIDALTLAQLHLFIDTSCEGDGHHWRAGERDIWQRNADALNAYERACILAGYAVSRQPGEDGGTVVRALRSTRVAPVKAAEQSARTGTPGATDEQVTYTGVVWCPTVPELHTYLARRNGRTFYTGNSAWQIDESALKTSIEPTLEAITAGLTERWLYPAVEALAGKAAVNLDRRIGFDVTNLRLRADRMAQALDLHTRLLLSDAALRTEAGFDDGDAPLEPEVERRMLLEIAMSRTSQSHEVAEAALKVFLPDLIVTPPLAPEADPNPPAGPTPVPDRVVEPVDQPPEGPPSGPGTPPAASSNAVLAAAELLVLRAVERANNRLNRGRRNRRPIPADQLDAAMVDAWDHAARTAEHLGLNPSEFVTALDTYTRALLTTGQDHTPDVLGRCLREPEALARG